MNKTRRKRHCERLRRAIAWLRELPCRDCGKNFPQEGRQQPRMEFDHNPNIPKSFNIGEAISLRVSWGRFVQEISKCEVVCSSCHQNRENRRRGRTALLARTDHSICAVDYPQASV